ncbi:hypothetical protein Trydic_g21050 [Trypoxylus dichotomus]
MTRSISLAKERIADRQLIFIGLAPGPTTEDAPSRHLQGNGQAHSLLSPQEDLPSQAGRTAVHYEDGHSIATTAYVNLATYADDVCIYSRSLNARVDRRLQIALDTLRDWRSPKKEVRQRAGSRLPRRHHSLAT